MGSNALLAYSTCSSNTLPQAVMRQHTWWADWDMHLLTPGSSNSTTTCLPVCLLPVHTYRLLERYQPQGCVFNDDIQGTACITLAGILSALRAIGKPLHAQKVLFFGAGEAGTGIGELIAQALVKQAKDEDRNLPIEEARKHC